MNTRKIFTLIISLLFLHAGIFAQDVEQKISEARSAYKSGNLEDARFALEEALQEIDQIIGKEILKVLPTDMGGVAATVQNDAVTGTSAGFGGLYVNREYGSSADPKSASILIISDSPLLAGINTILAMPMIVASADPNQKRIKVDGYKALLQKSENDDGSVSFDVQVPFSNSLLTFHCEGFDENEVLGMSNGIPMGNIVAATK